MILGLFLYHFNLDIKALSYERAKIDFEEKSEFCLFHTCLALNYEKNIFQSFLMIFMPLETTRPIGYPFKSLGMIFGTF